VRDGKYDGSKTASLASTGNFERRGIHQVSTSAYSMTRRAAYSSMLADAVKVYEIGVIRAIPAAPPAGHRIDHADTCSIVMPQPVTAHPVSP
jgi:hypothetical protein